MDLEVTSGTTLQNRKSQMPSHGCYYIYQNRTIRIPMRDQLYTHGGPSCVVDARDNRNDLYQQDNIKILTLPIRKYGISTEVKFIIKTAFGCVISSLTFCHEMKPHCV